MKVKKIALITVCLFAAACGQASKDNNLLPDPGLSKSLSLNYYSSCEDLISNYKEQAQKKMNESMDYFLFDKETSCGSIYGEDVYSSPASTGAEQEIETTFTSTNLQDEAVDESDILKTDGKYLYLASHSGVQIFKVWPKEDYAQVGTYTIPKSYEPATLYLKDSKLVVVYKTAGTFYGQDVDEIDKPAVHIDVLDVSQPEKPVIVSKKVLTGQLTATRRVGDVLHLVFKSGTGESSQLLYPDLEYYDIRAKACQGDDSAQVQMNQIVEDMRKKNQAIIDSMQEKDILPLFGDEGSQETLSCTSVAKEGNEASSNSNTSIKTLSLSSPGMYYYRVNSDYVGLLSLSLTDSNQFKASLIESQGYSYMVSAGRESIYLTRSDYNYEDYTSQTILHRFALADKGTQNLFHSYTATGSVEGSLLNQFSIDESKGVLRLATETGSWGDSQTQVMTLNAKNSDLSQIGSVGGLGVNEHLYGVRFIGDKAYVVTFKKIDPLYIVDLSEPAKPFIAGELKMPGYSSYLHPLDSDYLIGLGKDADDQGSFAWFQGLKLAAFDVSDSSNPEISDEEIIGSRGTTSFALEDHHAFTYDNDSRVLALPLEYHDGVSGGNDVGDFKYSGVHLFELSETGQIKNKGVIKLDDEQIGYSGWENAGPRRVVLIGEDDTEKNLVYILGNNALHQVDLTVSNNVVKSLASDNQILNHYGY